MTRVADESTFRRVFARLDGYRFRDLRHTGLTRFAQEGAMLAELMRRGGHADIQFVLQYQKATMERDIDLASPDESDGCRGAQAWPQECRVTRILGCPASGVTWCVVFVDCIHVKVRDGQVANRPIYVALAVTVDGNRDILGLWAGDGGEGAKHWLQVLTEIKNRGVEDVLMVVCDGLKGLPDSVNTVWSDTIVQTCVVHLIRASFRYVARQDWDKLARAMKPIYTADTLAAAEERFLEFSEEWGSKYPAIIRLWSNAWAEFVPFLKFDKEIRRIVCTTNAIESVNARIRKAVRARGHFLRRAGRAQVRPPRRHGTGPHRQGPSPLDHALEASTERVRHHLRRVPLGAPPLTINNRTYTGNWTDPRAVVMVLVGLMVRDATSPSPLRSNG